MVVYLLECYLEADGEEVSRKRVKHRLSGQLNTNRTL